MIDAFGVDRGEVVAKGDYSDAIDQSMLHRRKATRRLTGAEAAESIGGLAGAAAIFVPREAKRKAANKVFTPMWAKASAKRGAAEFTEDTKGAAKWGKVERGIARTARASTHPATLPVALIGGGLATGIGLRASAAHHNSKSNKIARQNNRRGGARIAVVGTGSKTRY